MSTDELIHRAVHLNDQGRFSEALALLASAATDARPEPSYWHARSVARQSLGDLDGAETDARWAMALDPQFEAAAALLRDIERRRAEIRAAGLDPLAPWTPSQDTPAADGNARSPSAPHQRAAPEPEPSPPSRRSERKRRTRPIIVTAFVMCLLVIIAAAVWFILKKTPPSEISAMVNTDANVRTAPDVRAEVVGVVSEGDEVTVECATNGWVRLASPYSGRFVWTQSLTLNALPTPC